MTYYIRKTDGSILTTLTEKELDEQYSMYLIGYPDSVMGVGSNDVKYHDAEIINGNFVKLLENSANYSAPNNPIDGQLWFSKTDKRLRYFDGVSWVELNGTNKNTISNCIIEIPQDIKLELNDGILTIKAGSKVYNGDGTVYTRSTDYTSTPSWGTATDIFVFPVINDTQIIGFDAISKNLVFSGDIAPTFSGNYAYWFDTTTKRVKHTDNAGTSWLEDRALPICLVNTNNDKITSINQVFNGFGYIGSTVFALPGVKGLTPNGRNEDGTLKNIQWMTNTVLTSQINPNNIIGMRGDALASTSVYEYDEQKNQNLSNGSFWDTTTIGKCLSDGTIILNKNVFHAIDYNNITDINNNITGIENNITDINNNITGIENNITDINNNITGIENNITDINNNIGSVSGLPGDKTNLTDAIIYTFTNAEGKGASLPLFTRQITNFKLQDVSWVNASNYSWLSGSVYISAYKKLTNQFSPNGKPLKGTTMYIVLFSDGETVSTNVAKDGTLAELLSWATEFGYTTNGAETIEDLVIYKALTSKQIVIENISIAYYETYSKIKIVLPSEIANINSLYEKVGSADFYILDTDNERFKLPRNKIRKLIYSKKPTTSDATWYDVYSDGFCKTGGIVTITALSSKTVNFPFEFKDLNISLFCQPFDKVNTPTDISYLTNNWDISTTSFTTFIADSDTPSYRTGKVVWTAENFLKTDVVNLPFEFDYYCLGNIDENTAIEIAGIKAETINNKADIDLGNVTTTAKTNIRELFKYDTANPISVTNGATLTKGGMLMVRGAGLNTSIQVFVNGAYTWRLADAGQQSVDIGNMFLVFAGDVITTAVLNATAVNMQLYPFLGE